MGLFQTKQEYNPFQQRTDEPFIDEEVVKKLKIYKFEKGNICSPLVFSYDEMGDNKGFRLCSEIFDLQTLKNYETIPTLVVLEIMNYLLPRDLFSLFQSCKYFHKISSSNIFWMEYYSNYFCVYNLNQEKKEENSIVLDPNLNWKKQFFKVFCDYSYADSFFRKRHQPEFVNRNEAPKVLIGTQFSKVRKIDYCVCGDKFVGKKSWLYRLWKGECMNGSVKEKMHIHFHMKSRPLEVHRKKPLFATTDGYDDNYVKETERLMLYYPYFVGNIGSTSANVRIVDGLEDTKGIEIARKTSSYYLVCFVADSPESYENAKKYVRLFDKEMQRGLGRYGTLSDKKNSILVGLKSDRVRGNKRNIQLKEIEDFVTEKRLKGYIEVSSKENHSVYLPFGILAAKITEFVIRLSG